MRPKVRIVHQTPVRTRLRVVDKIDDEDFFKQVQMRLSSHENVCLVEINPSTGGLLVHHSPHDQEWLKMDEKWEIENRRFIPLNQRVSRRYEELDQTLQSYTHGELNLSSIAALGLMGIGLNQVAQRKRFLPATLTLFTMALGIFLGQPKVSSSASRSQNHS